MIKKINLSQRPFHNRKLFWLICCGIMCGFWWLGQGLWASILETRSIVTRIESSVAKEEAALKKIRGTFPSGNLALTPDEIQKVQAAAWLIERRGFSWTGLLEDFEKELPEGVRLINISLREKLLTEKRDKNSSAKPNKVLPLSVQIVARSVDEMLKMVKNADQRGVFRFEPRVQDISDSGEYSFSLDVNYQLDAPNASQPRIEELADSEEEQ
jgi:hypothetical protein